MGTTPLHPHLQKLIWVPIVCHLTGPGHSSHTPWGAGTMYFLVCIFCILGLYHINAFNHLFIQQIASIYWVLNPVMALPSTCPKSGGEIHRPLKKPLWLLLWYKEAIETQRPWTSFTRETRKDLQRMWPLIWEKKSVAKKEHREVAALQKSLLARLVLGWCQGTWLLKYSLTDKAAWLWLNSANNVF